jgi:hypothetical protein
VGDRSKDKHTHTKKYDHIQSQMQNMFVTAEVLYRTKRKREKKRK